MANDQASRLAKIEGEGDDAVAARAAIAVVPVGRITSATLDQQWDLHGAAGGTRVRANTSMLVLVHGPGSGSAALAAESLLNTGKCRCDAGKVYVRCLSRR